MTPSEHAALSAELALALGAKSNRVPNGGVWVLDPPLPLGKRMLFDYRSPDVCLPLIEWLLTEHNVTIAHSRLGFRVTKGHVGDVANTLPEAVARAVIAVQKGKS